MFRHGAISLFLSVLTVLNYILSKLLIFTYIFKAERERGCGERAIRGYLLYLFPVNLVHTKRIELLKGDPILGAFLHIILGTMFLMNTLDASNLFLKC